MRRLRNFLMMLSAVLYGSFSLSAQIDVNRVMSIGRNALYFEDYVVSIGYFNQVIATRPWMAEPYFYRSVAKISLDDFSGADQDASQAIERNAFISKSYLVRGIARQNQKRYEEAKADYIKGLSLTPDNLGMNYNLAVVYMALKKYKEAHKQIDELRRFSKKNTQVLLLKSQLYLEEKDTTNSKKLLDTLISQDAFDDAPYAMRSQINYTKNKYKEALKDIDKAIELNGDELSYHTNKGIMLYQLNDLKGSMTEYSYVLSKNPVDKIALFNRALLRAYVGELNGAVEDLDNLIKLTPDNYIAIYNRGLLLAQIGSHKKAIADFNTVIGKYPHFYQGFIARSQSKRMIKDLAGADRDYWHAYDMQADLKKKSPQRQKENALEAAGKKEKETRTEDDNTIDKFNLLVVSEPSATPKVTYKNQLRGRIQDRDVMIQSRGMFALTYYDKSETDLTPVSYYAKELDDINKKNILPKRLILSNKEASLTGEQMAFHQQDIQQISDKVENNEILLIRRGIDYLLMQNHDQAIEDLSNALKINPSNVVALFERAVATVKKQEAEHSRINIEENAVKEKFVVTNKNSMGVTLPQDAKKFDSQLSLVLYNPMKDIDEVIRLAPDFAYAYYNRAYIFAQNKDVEHAIADYTKAISLNPKFGEAYFNRGLLYLSKGEATKGKKDLSTAGEYGVYESYNIIKRMNSK
ncbi:tetratricopeptide repeat protein [Porphyromonas pogonae]|uniref:tetratricopeptide repeat protein n=1 Tax=Porphyromonas pogonae TaxID=867595 RepID=UPI002E768CDA|nr:tetratricopeptide repeat protein [Porphyromonas pogonae]